MDTVDANNPADAGLAETGSAQTDDIDTEAYDRVEAPDDNEPEGDPDEAGDGEGGGDEGDEDPDKPAAAADEFEYEAEDGQKYKVPAALKDALLRRDDYTRKTQEVAAKNRELEEQRTAWETERTQQAESFQALRAEHATVAMLETAVEAANRRLDQPVDKTGLKLREVNWPAFRTQAQADPEVAEAYKALWAEFEAAKQDLAHYDNRLGEAKKDLQTKEEARLTEQRTKAAEALNVARQETGRVLAAEVPGWNTQRAIEVATFMNTDLGIAPEEIGALTDARTWKVVDRLMKAEAEIATLKKAQTQQRTADKHAKDQSSKPAQTPRGSGANTRDPATPRGDGLSTKAWMERRNAQVAAKRRA